MADPQSHTQLVQQDVSADATPKRGWRFWAVFPAICVTTMVAAVESTVTSTALPNIVHDLNAGDLYVWMMIFVVATFALGSGISGGARNSAMMIAGCCVQGVGGGGINLKIELIVSDLVPLRERGAFMGVVFAVFSIGTALGPFIGGAILKKIDYLGNAILIGSVVSVLIALSWAGTKYPWTSFYVLVPLFLGVFGLVLFHVYESMPWVKNPALPSRIFTRLIPAAALILAFINFMLLPAALLQKPIIFGISLLPTALLSALTGITAGIIITKTGRYRPLHIASFALITLGFGLFTRFNRHTSAAEWVVVQCIPAIRLGFMMTTNLPAVQADPPESDTATATGAFAFMRAYSSIWGVSIPSAIFNSQFNSKLFMVDDAEARHALSGGSAYSFATAALVKRSPHIQHQVIQVYTDSLKLSWYVSIGFALLGLVLCFVEKEISLRTTLVTEFGLANKKDDSDPAGGDAEKNVSA
ncbi:Efflux pump FUS6 [Cladobotryum mycophilum]|uniref:Efflux pump FUS6 n=1 Tax=Cladobotryum mycophilum TaxID=491253 RepID=A0ABR0SJ78_9HYPO